VERVTGRERADDRSFQTRHERRLDVAAAGRARATPSRDQGRGLLGRDLQQPRSEGELAAVQAAVEGERVAAQRIAAELVLGDAGECVACMNAPPPTETMYWVVRSPTRTG
jgi:hypothetical protein